MSVFDCIIVGAGPAGITAAVYAARKRMSFMLISQDVGGQTALSGDIENYTGYQFITGLELVAKFEEHLKQFNVPFHKDEAVLRVERRAAGGFNVVTAKEIFETRTVIIASGCRPRLLEAEGEAAFRNKGVSYCATCDGPLFSGKSVAIIGGGNSALDAALQMIRIAAKVYLIHVGPSLTGDSIMREKVVTSPLVEVIPAAVTKKISGASFVTGLAYEQAGVVKEIAVDGVLIEIGWSPNADFIDFVAKNEAGEIKVDHANRTDVAGVFAAGDVTDIPEKQIIVAAGEGAKAVLSVFRYLSQSR
jgi:alkyl hydroperoxide reductase subunit F